MLELSGVGKSFGGAVVIASASLTLKKGEVLCLTGPSGVGKTTLLEIMAGVTRPGRGTVKRASPPALMFQDDVLIPWLTAEEAIAYIFPPAMPESEQKERAAYWLKRFGLERTLYPAAMSGGMRRRLSMARAFAAGRECVLLDEPFAFLDDALCDVVADTIADCAATGCAIALASHTTAPLESARFAGLPLRCIPVDRTPVRIGDSAD